MRPSRSPFAQLRTWCEFWVDDGRDTPCCLTTRDESLFSDDAELFDCETCPLNQRLTELDPENVAAWHLFNARLASRLVLDFHLGGDVLRHALADEAPDVALDRIARCAVIYDVLHPPPKRD